MLCIAPSAPAVVRSRSTRQEKRVLMSSRADLSTPNTPLLPPSGAKGRQAGMFDELEELEDEAAERALDMSTQAVISLPASTRFLDLISSLRIKLVVPYVFLTLITAMIGTFVVTRLVTSSVRERFANQLLEAGRVASDGIVRRERTHLEALRLMAFTQGVPEALAVKDGDRLQQLLYPLVVNGNVHFLTAIDAQGQEINNPPPPTPPPPRPPPPLLARALL